MLKRKLSSVSFAAVGLLVLSGAVVVAQRHFMLASAPRPEVKVMLSGAVERAEQSVPVEKAQIVKEGEVLDWTIRSDNNGNGAALQYKTVAHVPAGTTFIAGSAKVEGSGKVAYSID